MSVMVFWVMVIEVVTNISENHIASLYPEDGSDTFLQNIGNYLQDHTLW
jgi:hypothetical protein